MSEDLTPREKIDAGICVSPLTTERCPYCVDVCDAHQNELEKIQDVQVSYRDAFNSKYHIGSKVNYIHNGVVKELTCKTDSFMYYGFATIHFEEIARFSQINPSTVPGLMD